MILKKKMSINIKIIKIIIKISINNKTNTKILVLKLMMTLS